MLDTLKIKELYTKIQSQLGILIPEKWESIYLYAGVNTQIKDEQNWELYFYYFPKGVLKKNPINVYEVPSKFSLEEDEYLEYVQQLCETIKKLRLEYQVNKQKLWKSLSIIIQNETFRIDYNYSCKNKYSNLENHVLWKYKYLNIPIGQFSKSERNFIKQHIESNVSEETQTYECKISSNYMYSEIGYNVEKRIKQNVEKNKKVIPNKVSSSDEVVEIRNQMLRFY